MVPERFCPGITAASRRPADIDSQRVVIASRALGSESGSVCFQFYHAVAAFHAGRIGLPGR